MWKLAPALVAASALHVAVWVGVRGWPAEPGAASARPVARGTPAPPVAPRWQVRQVSMPSAPATSMALATTAVLALTPPPAEPDAPPPELQAPALTAEGQSAPVAETAPVPAVTAASAPADASALPDPYWPRPQLSRPPVPRTVVAIDFPAGEPTPGRHTAVLALYIDEAGLVQRVDAKDAQLPGPYIEAARNAFLTTRFEPGEIQGRAVKSLIHVEVQFDQAEAQLAARPTRPSRHFAGLP